MALPKLTHPTTKITVPSSKQVIVARPFTVKEEKILLMAQGDNADTMVEALYSIIRNCVVKPSDFDPSKIALFDVEYIFLKLRAFSVNNVIELTYHDADDNEDYELELNLDEVEVYFDPSHNPKINLTDEVGIIMKYPDLSTMDLLRKQAEAVTDGDNQTALDLVFAIYVRSIDKVWDDDGVYVSGIDFTDEEANQFLETVSAEGFEKIQHFLDTMPILKHQVSYMTKKGETKTITLQGIQDFFR